MNLESIDLEILLCHILKVDRGFLKAYPEILLSKRQIKEFCKLAARRLQHEPMAYITGHKYFWDLDLLVTKDVLIPRSDTEILVEQALAKIPLNYNAKILELGTGSGAVALSIAKHRPNATVYATDLSSQALKIAKKNAKLLNINNIIFCLGSWFNALSNLKSKLNLKFDLIISNPPYIADSEIGLCDREIFYEPELALFAKNNGLDCLENIIFNSINYLNNNLNTNNKSYLLLEHGVNQANSLAEMLNQAGFREINHIQDLAGLNRVLIGSCY